MFSSPVRGTTYSDLAVVYRPAKYKTQLRGFVKIFNFYNLNFHSKTSFDLITGFNFHKCLKKSTNFKRVQACCSFTRIYFKIMFIPTVPIQCAAIFYSFASNIQCSG